MKKVLFICNTYMQLICLTQIKEKIIKESMVDIIISDHAKNTDFIVSRLKKFGGYRNVYYIKTRYQVYEQNSLLDFKDVIMCLFDKGIKEVQEEYAEIYFYNYDVTLFRVYGRLIKEKNVVLARVEEGIASYSELESNTIRSRRLVLASILRKIFNKKNPQENVSIHYLFHPELVKIDSTYKIPMIEKSDLNCVEKLNEIFGYDSSIEIKEKYIYFGSSYDIDGYKVDENSIVAKIADVVGRENLIVKRHPRDKSCEYKNNNINVLSNSDYPWELIDLNNNYKDKVFITLSSSSVLTANAITKMDYQNYILYPTVMGKDEMFDRQQDTSINNLLVKLREINMCLNTKICTLEQMFNELQK